MVVCKFFQQGYCRYGQNCRFDHVYGSKYNYQSNAPAQHSQPSGITDEQLVNQVQTDVQAILKGGQWILSSYAPFKKSVFPGIPDLSPEEARLFIYEAKANNNLDQAIAYMNNMIKECYHKYEQLLQPTPAIIKVLRSNYKGEIVTSPFANTQNSFGSSANSASSIFRSAAQGTSAFGQSNASSVFSGASSNVFGQRPDSSAAKSIFAQATHNTFGSAQTQPANNFFGAPTGGTVSPQSIFAQANNNNNQSVFGANQQNGQSNPADVFASANQTVFGSDPFGQKQNTSPFANTQANVMQSDPFALKPNSPFGNTSVFQSQQPSGFGANVFQQQTMTDEVVVYSNMESLSAEDLEAFKAEDFKLGFIPEVPPPKALCF